MNAYECHEQTDKQNLESGNDLKSAFAFLQTLVYRQVIVENKNSTSNYKQYKRKIATN